MSFPRKNALLVALACAPCCAPLLIPLVAAIGGGSGAWLSGLPLAIVVAAALLGLSAAVTWQRRRATRPLAPAPLPLVEHWPGKAARQTDNE